MQISFYISLRREKTLPEALKLRVIGIYNEVSVVGSVQSMAR